MGSSRRGMPSSSRQPLCHCRYQPARPKRSHDVATRHGELTLAVGRLRLARDRRGRTQSFSPSHRLRRGITDYGEADRIVSQDLRGPGHFRDGKPPRVARQTLEEGRRKTTGDRRTDGATQAEPNADSDPKTICLAVRTGIDWILATAPNRLGDSVATGKPSVPRWPHWVTSIRLLSYSMPTSRIPPTRTNSARSSLTDF